MNKIYANTIAFITCIIVAMHANAAPKYPTVEAFIAAQKNIRIFADSSDGFGNQTASQNLVIRLRRMGYSGKFEFIYPDYVTSKITTLFGLPNDISDDYVDLKNNIEFIKLKYFVENHKSMSPVALGLTGAYVGTACDDASADGADVSKLDELTCNNFSNFSKADAFIQLSPFMSNGNHEEASKFDTHIFYQNEVEPHVQINSDAKYIVMPVASLQDAKKYLADDPYGQALLVKKPALKALIDSIDQQTINVMPIYGYTLQLRKACESDNSDTCYFNVLSNMIKIIAGARTAQNAQRQIELNKPLVIPVFYDYNTEANWLLKLLRGELWNNINTPNILEIKSLINNLGLSNSFFIANADDSSAVSQIKNLQDGQILLLSMGPLPKIVFNGIYNHTASNIWPQIREGANSLNSLILTGKPHMRCSDEGWELDLNLIKDENLRQWMSDFYSDFCVFNPDSWNTDIVSKNISTFILQSQNSKSALSRYFADLKQEALKSENDRIYFALEEVVRH